jgi:ABC-type transport system involved in multi-copper enzyme maturation permease subunit
MRSFVPILAKEMRTQIRGNRPAAVLSVYIGLLLVALIWLYDSIVDTANVGAPLVSAQIGQALFIGLTLSMQMLIVFLAPATSVNSVSNEYEQYTFDILLATTLSAAHILLAKLLVALAFVGLLLVAALPLFSVVVLFGGVEPASMWSVLITLALSAGTGCMLGLFCSVVTRQTYTATLLCYAILVALIGGSLFAANIWSATHISGNVPAGYIVANPLSAMATVLADAQPPEFVSIGSLRPLIILGMLTQGTVVHNGNDIAVLPLYRATWALYLGASLLLFWVCLHSVQATQERRMWKFYRSDGVLAVLVVLYAVLIWLTRGWWFAAF